MMGWQLTAANVQCQYVGNFATIMVQPDGTARCSYVNRHGTARDSKKKLRNCKWPDCPLVSDFREQALTL
jgi:phage tail tape-measure protein